MFVRTFRRAVQCACVVLLAACSGGGDKSTAPVVPPVNNTPASVTLSQSGSITLTSGTTSTVTASVLTAGGVPLSSASVTWASSDASVVTVTGGVITGVRVGTATITASSGNLTSSGLAVTVTPGPVAVLTIRAQPTNATVAVAFQTQPVIELRDAAGNFAATTPVAVSIASGGGTLSGTTTTTSVSGVATFTGVSLVGVTGPRTLRFAAGPNIAATSASFALAAGAPAALAVRTIPAGVAVAQRFATQPVVEIQDAGTNVVATATSPVTVTVASGSGTLAPSSTLTIPAVAGVAAFTDLVLTGTVGPQTLSFSSPGLTAIQTSGFALAPGIGTQLGVRTQPVGGALGAPLLTPPVVELRDVSGNVATGSTSAVSATVTFGAGAITGGTVNALAGVATFSDLVIAGSTGDRELTFSAAGIVSTTSTRFSLVPILYGTAAQKIRIVDVGDVFAPVSSSPATPTFLSRAPSRASVDVAGRITAKAEGAAWLVASAGANADSLLTIVSRSPGGPVLRTSLTAFVVKAGSQIALDLILDPRTTPVGAATVFVTVNTQDGPVATSWPSVAAPSGVSIVSNAPTTGVTRFSVVSGSSISAPITFGRVSFVAGGTPVTINVTVIDVFSPTGGDLSPVTTSTSYPLVIVP